MASLKVPSSGGPPYTSSQPASSDGPRFLKWIRRSRSDITSAKSTRQTNIPASIGPVQTIMANFTNPSPKQVNGLNGHHAPQSSSNNDHVNGSAHVNGMTNGDSQHLAPSTVPVRRLSKLKTVHPSGINRTNLNTLEKLLKSIDSLHRLVNTVLSDDLYADLPVDDPNALNAGIVGDLACLPGHLRDDLTWIWKQVRLKMFSDELIDDRNERVLETTVKLLSSLPSDSKFQIKVTNEFVGQLYNQLPHPPLTHLGTRPMWHQETNVAPPVVGLTHPTTWPIDKQLESSKVPLLMEGPEDYVFHHEWRYRTADGSNNSRISPHLGRAGGPYAKTVTAKTILPADLPDPELVFEELMAAEGPRDGSGRRGHPAGVSSMLFYLATIIIHDCFQSSPRDANTNTTSSYLDLSPLYGKDGKEQQTVRTFERGLLKKDTFANFRICGFPPGVSALLISFNRFHNYVAGQLYEINEGGRFRGTNEDHDLFQTARLITTGLYVNIILVDYVRTILNLQRTNSPWRLDPRLNADVYDPRKTPEGFGNQVSVEFNLLYRWHSATSKRDEEWTERLFERALDKARETARQKATDGHKSSDHPPTPLPDSIWDLTDKHLVTIGHAFKDEFPLDKPETWPLDGHEREPDGHFDDDFLNELITSSTEDLAGAFGARNVPRIMRCVEMDGIRKARNWKVSTLNEFRRYFRLQPHKTFESISTRPGVADSLRALYGDPDHVELYPGLVAEDAKEAEAPGSGLCPGMTIGQAILADAVNLVRGDRFYTVDNTAANLTNWGWTLIQPDTNVAGGGVMYKLLMKAFPNFYKGNSIYALYPFTVPKQMMQALKDLGQESDFDVRRPCYKPLWSAQITSYNGVKKILQDHDNFHVPWGPHIKMVTKKDFMLGGDMPCDFAQHKQWISAMYSSPGEQKRQIRKLFETITVDLLRERTHKTRHGYQVDAIAEIGNIVSAQSAAHFFHVPLKSHQHPHGLVTPQQYFTIMCICFAWAFLDIDESKDFSLRLYATEAGKQFTPVVKLGAIAAKNHTLVDMLHKFPYFKDINDMTSSYGAQLIRKLLADGKTIDEITAELIPMMTGMVGTHAQSFAQMLDLFFTKEYSHHWEHIRELSQSDDDEAFEQLERYALEASRLSPAGFGLFRTVAPETANVTGCGEDGSQTCDTKEGDTIFVNFVSAGRDPTVFEDPLKIKLNRPRELYIQQGIGKHTCPGKRITPVAMASMLRVFARLKNLKPVAAPYHNGPNGEESYLKWRGVFGTPFRVYMRPDGSDDWPFPTTLKVSFTAFDPDDNRMFKCDMPHEEKKKANTSWWPPHFF